MIHKTKLSSQESWFILPSTLRLLVLWTNTWRPIGSMAASPHRSLVDVFLCGNANSISKSCINVIKMFHFLNVEFFIYAKKIVQIAREYVLYFLYRIGPREKLAWLSLAATVKSSCRTLTQHPLSDVHLTWPLTEGGINLISGVLC